MNLYKSPLLVPRHFLKFKRKVMFSVCGWGRRSQQSPPGLGYQAVKQQHNSSFRSRWLKRSSQAMQAPADNTLSNTSTVPQATSSRKMGRTTRQPIGKSPRQAAERRRVRSAYCIPEPHHGSSRYWRRLLASGNSRKGPRAHYTSPSPSPTVRQSAHASGNTYKIILHSPGVTPATSTGCPWSTPKDGDGCGRPGAES